MKVKTFLSLGALAGALTLILTGCGQKDVSIDVAKTADGIKDAVTFKDTISELPESRFDTVYDVQEGDVVKQKVYVNSGATAEEVAVIEAKDTDAAARVKKAAEQRIADQKEGFENYQPAEMTKLGSPVLEVKGKYVILVVCDKPDEARDAVGKLVG